MCWGRPLVTFATKQTHALLVRSPQLHANLQTAVFSVVLIKVTSSVCPREDVSVLQQNQKPPMPSVRSHEFERSLNLAEGQKSLGAWAC